MAFANCANVFHHTSRHLQAFADIDQAMALELGNSQFHYNKGNILLKSQRISEAAEQYQWACTFDEGFELAHLKWADLLMTMPRPPICTPNGCGRSGLPWCMPFCGCEQSLGVGCFFSFTVEATSSTRHALKLLIFR